MQIFVIGMHRSGTSVVSRLLNLMGVYFGSENVGLPQADDNAKGFWERKDVVSLNNKLLRENGHEWFKISSYNESNLEQRTVENFNTEARRIIANIDGFRPWFIKDSRLCFTLPLWIKFTEVPLAIFVYRHPLEVALSLKERNEFPIEYGLALWEEYNIVALNNTKNIPTVFIDFNEILSSSKKPLAKLYSFLKQKNVRFNEISKNEIDGFLDSKLYHQKTLHQHELLSDSQKKLYDLLSNESFETKSSIPKISKKSKNTLRKFELMFDKVIHFDQIKQENLSLIRKLESSEEAIKKLSQLNQKNNDLKISNKELQLRVLDRNNLKLDFQNKLNDIKFELQKKDLKLLEVKLEMESKLRKKDKINQRVLDEKRSTIKLMKIKNRVRRAFGFKKKGVIKKKKVVKKKAKSLIATPIEPAIQDSNGPIFSIDLPDTSPYLLEREFNRYKEVSDGDIHQLKKNEVETILIRANKNEPVSIVVSIYNSYAEVKACIESILKYSTYPFQLVLINDKSPDDEIKILLETYRNIANIRVIHNDQNLGFVKSANIGFRASNFDTILLNSDTIVSPRWIQKLLISSYTDPKIATSTPFSNASGVFSVPEIGVNKSVPAYLSNEEMSRIVENQKSSNFFEIPTGNGFCMFIKRQALDEVDSFDEKSFGRGYGEENDFCMKLAKRGWKNILTANLFIYHKGNSSFGSEKQALVKEHRKILDELHPDYPDLVRQFVSDQNINDLRKTIGEALVSRNEISRSTKKNILYVLHEGGGGVPNTTKDLMPFVQNSYNVFVLTSDSQTFFLKEYSKKGLEIINRFELKKKWSALRFFDAESQALYLSIITSLNIDLVHIRHLFKHSLDLPEICSSLRIPYVLSLHDFYFVSPSINLLDMEGKFNSGTLPVPWMCPTPLLDALPNDQLTQDLWTESMTIVLKNASLLITTSQSTKDIHCNFYPFLKSKNFLIIEHGRDFNVAEVTAPMPPTKSEKIKFLFLGNITEHKGSKLIQNIIDRDLNNRFEFHFAGSVDENLNGKGVFHGSYSREEIPKMVEKIEPHFGLVLSICPETFSHTLTEFWGCALPVIGSNLGAINDRIVQHGGGWTIEIDNPESFFKLIEKISDNDYQQKLIEVRNLKLKTVKEMSYQYLSCYHEVINKTSKHKIALITPGEGLAGSSFIRCLLPFTHPNFQQFFEVHQLNKIELDDIENYIEEYSIETIIIQRNAIETKSIAKFKSLTKRFNVVFEIDDDLFNISSSHPEYLHYSRLKSDLIEIIKASKITFCSTNKLKKIVGEYSKKVRFFPNSIDEKLWLTPTEVTKAKKDPSVVNIGYIGSYTHGSDLLLIKDAIIDAQDILKKKYDIQLNIYVIGGMRKDESWFNRVKIPVGKNVYPEFVNWLRNFVDWDFALAPLEQTKLNESKSCIKYLEYTLLNLPGIYSNCGEYSESVAHLENGIIVDNSILNWTNSIIELATNIELRGKLRVCSKQKINEEHLANSNMDNYIQHLNFDKTLLA